MKRSATSGNTLVEENLQYIWILLGVALVFVLLIIGVRISEGMPITIDVENIIFLASVVAIPLVAVNTIYFFKYYGLDFCRNKQHVLALKITGLYLGVILGTLIFEAIYAAYGIIDDDYIVMGSFELSASASEVVSNVFSASFLGIPIFIKQQIRQSSSIALEAKKQELDSAQRLNVQSQLEALQARVNPHFLYNSLNSIASLIHVNPDQAEQMVVSLSELFRYSLNYSNGQLSTIAEEIKMVQTYLGIELIRFGDKLSYNIEVDQGLEQVLIPRFLLQPIVENAVKHGTSKISSGKIIVQVKQEQGSICFSIADNGPDFSDAFEAGYGLKCVTDQLNLLYKNKHVFEMMNTPKKQVRIVLENMLKNA